MANQLAENAKYPAVVGALPEAHHNQVVTLDGAFASRDDDDDLFRDRLDEPAATRLRLLVLRDDDGRASTTDRTRVSQAVADARGVPTTVLVGEGASPVERLAGLVGLVDFASAYLALAQGIDPSPVPPIDELKRRLEPTG
jgi:glucose/mannose-6-phosphate isomerase